MNTLKKIRLVTVLTCFVMMPAVIASDSNSSYLQKWKEGLTGSRLTAYTGSVISLNSSLTVINLCHNGLYNYSKEGSWSVRGQATGSNKSRLTGRWSIKQQGAQFYLVYAVQGGESGQFPIYLQNNGRVNIGGVGYVVEKGRAVC